MTEVYGWSLIYLFVLYMGWVVHSSNNINWACAHIGAPHSVVFTGFSSKCASRLACTCVDST